MNFFLRVGPEKAPEGFETWKRVTEWHNLLGYKGVVEIHLHGNWWIYITPNQLYQVLINLSTNEQPPLVTIGL
jgi:hypothetical protein